MLPLGGGGKVGEGPSVGVIVGWRVGGRSVRVTVGVPVAVAVCIGVGVYTMNSTAVGITGKAVGFAVAWAIAVA